MRVQRRGYGVGWGGEEEGSIIASQLILQGITRRWRWRRSSESHLRCDDNVGQTGRGGREGRRWGRRCHARPPWVMHPHPKPSNARLRQSKGRYLTRVKTPFAPTPRAPASPRREGPVASESRAPSPPIPPPVIARHAPQP